VETGQRGEAARPRARGRPGQGKAGLAGGPLGKAWAGLARLRPREERRLHGARYELHRGWIRLLSA
jgi:hypothetical protein